MALKRPTVFPNGANAEYWIISGIEDDKVSGKIRVTLYGYLNKTVRDADIRQPIAPGPLVREFTHAEFAEVMNPLLTALYTKLKATEYDVDTSVVPPVVRPGFFSTAEDE